MLANSLLGHSAGYYCKVTFFDSSRHSLRLDC